MIICIIIILVLFAVCMSDTPKDSNTIRYINGGFINLNTKPMTKRPSPPKAEGINIHHIKIHKTSCKCKDCR